MSGQSTGYITGHLIDFTCMGLCAPQAELEARCQEVAASQNQLQRSEEECKRFEQQLRETRVGVAE